ncbi:hypothetical protein [uncultured Aquimarina sp.]|uniref:hypothetical protein n=1 Tax=uncultured Aquimarina sp. TaxID=575652 RepID=UPI002603CA70|nr:hypothetical protein [uncultured Aquimarina sp.]
MIKKGLYIFLLISTITVTFLGCNQSKHKSKHGLKVSYTADTLKVAYTYWWPQSGPFIGMCGQRYAMVFTGVITKIDISEKEPEALYTSQKGIIEIEQILTVRHLEKKKYDNQRFFSSDCFYEQGLKEGDKVVVFCYEYEDYYSIPGKKSIIKIKNDNDPIIKSIKKYIETDQNPLAIKDDIELWKKYDLDENLTQIIQCKEN